MTLQIAILLGIVAIAVALFWWERVSPDVTALGVLLTLVLTGLLPGKRRSNGFSSDTVIMILGLLILTAALQRTGVVDMAGRAVARNCHPTVCSGGSDLHVFRPQVDSRPPTERRVDRTIRGSTLSYRGRHSGELFPGRQNPGRSPHW